MLSVLLHPTTGCCPQTGRGSRLGPVSAGLGPKVVKDRALRSQTPALSGLAAAPPPQGSLVSVGPTPHKPTEAWSAPPLLECSSSPGS